MSTKTKTLRRIITASMSSALIISLASCSAAKDNSGLLDKDEVYATAGDYTVTVGDLWDELKWSSKDVLDDQITNVILDKYIKRVEIVMNKSWPLADDDIKALGYDTEGDNVLDEAGFKKLKEKYETRMVDYVVQDIYNWSFSTEDYWDSFDSLSQVQADLLEAKYVNEIYTDYIISEINGEKIADIIANPDYKDYENKKDDYLKIANGLSQIYYPLYAKELLAWDRLDTDVQDAIDDALEDDDTEEEDAQWAYYASSEFVSKFKSEYTNNYDMSAVIINFADSDELNDTLRAFGLKLYNKKLYFIFDNSDDGEYTLDADGHMSYQNYITYYDDFANSNLANGEDAEGNQTATVVPSQAVLEIYIQIYNYVYGGYREKLASQYTFSTDYTQLNNLRRLTDEIIAKYSTGDDTSAMRDNAIAVLKANNNDETYYTADELSDMSGTFKTYMYETLTLDSASTCYSTSGQSTTNGTTLAYKFDEYIDSLGDATLEKYASWYSSDLSTYEILDYITDTEENPTLKDDIEELLRQEDLTESKISSYMDDELDYVTVKIYNEACEIAYSVANSDYSNALKKNKDSNVLATIQYKNDDTDENWTYNLDIVANPDDENSVMIPGKDTEFGVYDYLEAKNGTTTAVDLISNMAVKDTQAYKDTEEDTETYETYLENVLLSFSNGGLSGYSADMGKYNFLMMYFHTAKIDEIIKNYYRVQYASINLLTDYSNTDLISFFEQYATLSETNYFSLGGTRLVVYFDGDDDGDADDTADWKDKVVDDSTSPFDGKTFEYVAKQLIYDIYNKISASTDSHTDKASSLVEEINATAKVVFEEDPISSENTWAKYRHLGLKVKTEDFTATNSTLEIDFNLKQRLYDYARGHNTDNTKTYQYFINDTTPTCYIEPIQASAVSESDDTIVETDDGYNLIMVTSGTASSSAKWTEEDNDEKILENIVIKYNDDFVTIDNIYNDDDNLNTNQIRLYVLDYAVNGSSTLSPASIATAESTFLEPLMTRFTGDETQRIILLSFIANKTDNASAELYDIVTFANTAYNGADGVFANMIAINEVIADDYIDVYNDTTKTSSQYTYTDENGNEVTWWSQIQSMVQKFLKKDKEAGE